MRSSIPRRSSDPSWMRPITERLSPAVRVLIIADAVLFAFYAVVRQVQHFFNEHLALTPRFLVGEVWQPVTALFVHIDPLSFFFNMIGLWFVGATIERLLGTRRFLVLFFATGVVSNLAMVLTSVWWDMPQIFAGCGVAVLGLFVAFGVHFGRTPARVLGGLVLEARTLAAILVGFAVLADVTRGAWPSLVGDLLGVATAFLLMGGGVGSFRELVSGWRVKRHRRRYQVIDGGRDDRKDRGGPSMLN